jgi:hypothetical protein
MKASFDLSTGVGGLPCIVKFMPENEADRKVLLAVANQLDRPHMITHRGFNYMIESVEFYVQQQPSRD